MNKPHFLPYLFLAICLTISLLSNIKYSSILASEKSYEEPAKIELSYIRVYLEGQGMIAIEWEFSYQHNFKQTEIYRNGTLIGVEKANMKSWKYKFIDRHPLNGTNYYELRFIDYSNINKYGTEKNHTGRVQ